MRPTNYASAGRAASPLPGGRQRAGAQLSCGASTMPLAGSASGAVQEIVQASGQLGVIGDLGSDLGAHVSAGRHELATDTAAAAASIIVTTSSGCETIAT
jgi:hypothetical protein